MAQWTSNANTSGAPKWGIQSFRSRKARGSGNAQQAANNTSLVVNTTPDSFTLGEEAGLFPVTPGAKANTSGESGKVHGLGWALRLEGEGPVASLTATNGFFANGETVLISNGSGSNAYARLTTNATGNLVSASMKSPGPTFTTTGQVGVAFIRERHVANLNFSNGTGVTIVGAGNGNTINVTVSNTQLTYGVNAHGSFTSNSTGGFTNTQTQAISWTGANVGLFANNQTNTAVLVTFTNANGTVVTFSGGTPTVTANLAPSTGGTVAAGTLGGRAGRVTYEMLVMNRHINATATSSVANSAGILPE